MASIFAGTEPPSWLTELTRSRNQGEVGSTAGTLVAGLLNAFQRKPDKETMDPFTGDVTVEKGARKGFAQGLFEARMNQEDPLWQLKARQNEALWATRMAQAETAHALANQRIEQSKAQMHDAPLLAEWANKTREQRRELTEKGLAPVMEGIAGANSIKQIGLADATAEAMEETRNAKTIAGQMAIADSKDFLKRASALTDPASRARIAGMTRNEDGTPSAMQWEALALAEEQDRVSAENKVKLAELEAIQRGQVPATTISGTKVTTRYTEPKPESATKYQYEVPTEVSVGGKKYVAFRGQLKDPSAIDPQIKARETMMRLKYQGALEGVRNAVTPKTFEAAKTNLANVEKEWLDLYNKMPSAAPQASPAPAPAAPAAAPSPSVPRDQLKPFYDDESEPEPVASPPTDSSIKRLRFDPSSGGLLPR